MARVNIFVVSTDHMISECADVDVSADLLYNIPCRNKRSGRRVRLVMKDLNAAMLIYELHVIGH